MGVWRPVKGPAAPETMGSEIIVITGPKAVILANGGNKVGA